LWSWATERRRQGDKRWTRSCPNEKTIVGAKRSKNTHTKKGKRNRNVSKDEGGEVGFARTLSFKVEKGGIIIHDLTPGGVT